MPPVLALALCTLFVGFLLRLERKQCPQVTRVLWIPTVWMLVAASRPIGRWFNIRRTDPDASGPLDLALLILLLLCCLIVLAHRRGRWKGALRENPWILGLLLFMLVSIAWSAIPAISFRRWIKELLALLMALVVFSEPDPRQAFESILRRTAYMLIPFSLLVIKYFPVYGVDYGPWSGEQEWIGVAQQKNSLASMAIISAVVLGWSLYRRWALRAPTVWKYQTHTEGFVLLLTLYLLGGPGHSVFYSATSTYALLAGLIGGAWILFRGRAGKRIKAGTLMAVVLFLIVLGVATVFVSGSGIRFFASSAGRDETLTGRTQVWTSLLPVVMKSPWIGHGFGGFWMSKTREAFHISGAHSGYMDVVLGTGFAGLTLAAMFLLSSCRKAHAELAKDAGWGLLWIVFLIITAVHNIGESSLDTFTAQLTALLLLFAVTSAERPRFQASPAPAEADAVLSDS